MLIRHEPAFIISPSRQVMHGETVLKAVALTACSFPAVGNLSMEPGSAKAHGCPAVRQQEHLVTAFTKCRL